MTIPPQSLETRIADLERGLAEAHEVIESVAFALAAALFEPGLPNELRQSSQIIPTMPYAVGTDTERATVMEGRRIAGYVLRAIADRLDLVASVRAALPPSTETPQ